MRFWAPWLAAAGCLTILLLVPRVRLGNPAPRSAGGKNADNRPADTNPPFTPNQYDRTKSALEKVADQAQKIIDTELLLFGGSIAILLGTGYHRPSARNVRASYLAFLPGWGAFAVSMYHGYAVRSVYLGFLLAPPVTRDDALGSIEDINHASIYQSGWFYVGLGVFACWLVFYLGWWIFTESIQEKNT